MFYAEIEISVRMSSGYITRCARPLVGVLSCIQMQTTRRLLNDHPERSSRSWLINPPGTCSRAKRNEGCSRGRRPAQPSRQQRTRARITGRRILSARCPSLRCPLCAGRRQEAVRRRLWVAFLQAHPIARFLFVATSGDYRSSAPQGDSPIARNPILPGSERGLWRRRQHRNGRATTCDAERPFAIAT